MKREGGHLSLAVCRGGDFCGVGNKYIVALGGHQLFLRQKLLQVERDEMRPCNSCF